MIPTFLKLDIMNTEKENIIKVFEFENKDERQQTNVYPDGY